ncbi:alpha/beta fold hydrolase [Solimicrobium silvestre]|uniref:Alpha/beta hydrolase family n=1 Tax=Solimicrobium silvestre TaxID=2099400 RepID=A0A2S9H0K2_9BURK|nr:alpha/beta hydrolase [Solimicrobium silvestre]PRC93488.1 Alpha/beta hydrolase family [Solimicrobium silvestre]
MKTKNLPIRSDNLFRTRTTIVATCALFIGAFATAAWSNPSASNSATQPLDATAPVPAITTKSISTLFEGIVVEPVHGENIEQLKINTPQSHSVVVFENGARETLETWDKVIADISKDATVFAYNRPGYGRSETTSAPRDGRTIVEELRQILQQQGLKPPYLLVGHSMGGLYMQLFARMYPQEVQGVVLVDSLYPGIIKKPEDFPLYTRIAKYLFLNNTLAHEIDEIHHTGEIIQSLPWRDDIPMVRLFNVPKSAGAIGLDFGVVNDDPQTIAMVKALYPKARQVIVDSDHRIQAENPEFVISAIREVMAIKR